MSISISDSVESSESSITYEWRGPFTNIEVNALHAEAFEHRPFDDDWSARLGRFSLGWVVARRSSRIVGFVNVLWDGGVHAFILDTAVALTARHEGVGAGLVSLATERTRETACEWLHVDFEEHLRDFYFDACNFQPTDAGLIRL